MKKYVMRWLPRVEMDRQSAWQLVVLMVVVPFTVDIAIWWIKFEHLVAGLWKQL